MKTRIRTYPIKGLMIFLSIVFIVSLAAVIFFIFSKDDVFIVRLLVWIFCGAFTILSAIVMIYQLSTYTEIKDDNFISHSFLSKKVIKIEDIQKIRNIDGEFHIYVDNRKVA